jgi:hypothetical protein
MSHWFWEQYDNHRGCFILAIFLGLAVGFFAMPFIIDLGILPETHQTVVEENGNYLGYGVVEENDTVIYETPEDKNQSLINKGILTGISLIIAFISSIIIYFILRTIINKYDKYMES